MATEDKKMKAALIRLKVKLQTTENHLKKKVATCVSNLPDEQQDYEISPSASMQSSYNEEPSLTSTPAKASSVIRRAGKVTSDASVKTVWSQDSTHHQVSAMDETTSSVSTTMSSRRSDSAKGKPFLIMDDLRRLKEVYSSYSKLLDDMM